MKTNKYFMLAAITCGAAFVSCSNEDLPVYEPVSQNIVIGFENATLNEDGYWIGNTEGTPFDNWGSTGYACQYEEAGVAFPVNYTPSWGSWSGFAISSRTQTTYATITPDQYNSTVGNAHGGNNFCIVQPYGESLDFDTPVTLKGFWYTNTAWVVDAILNGDGLSPGNFTANDWFKCILYPTPADGSLSGARYEIDLAKDGDYVQEWKYCDLSNVDAFKNIKSLSFNFEGTKENDWGLTTPAYICIDDVEVVITK